MFNPGSNKIRKSGYAKKPEDVIEEEKKHLDLKNKKVTGLAISGGGIRSASFGLGVMQALVNNNKFSDIDYMSTVSGGGYLGSALTWALHQDKNAGTNPENFPLGKNPVKINKDEPAEMTSTIQQENKWLDYIRQHSNYLTPTPSLDIVSFGAVVMRSMAMSLFVYFSFFVVAMTTSLWLIYQISEMLTNNQISMGLLPIFTNLGFPESIVNLYDSVMKEKKGLMIFVGVILFAIIFLKGFLYSLGTFFSNEKISKLRYKTFITGQKSIGLLLKLSLTCLVFGSLAFVTDLLQGISSLFVASGSTLFGTIVGLWQYKKAQQNEKSNGTKSDIVIYLGAFALFYGVMLLAYLFATHVFLTVHHVNGKYVFDFQNGLFFIILIALSLIFGLIVNLNLIGPHHIWRNRLMEAFLPNKKAVENNEWDLATQADSALMEDMCDVHHPKPYHIINTNIILSNSSKVDFSSRGGDNFIISPLYCGSNATGWRTTKTFRKGKKSGITLATAMATSAAALNPNAGVSGEGVTRNYVVSVLLSFLNLRLGYWTNNPKWPRTILTPNFFIPGLTSEIFKKGLTENNLYIQLSDGGHFENLAIYELIRRKLDLIILSDGGADAPFNFDDLANAIEKVWVDFGARIQFVEGFKTDNILPGTAGDSPYQQKYQIAKRGFAVADITYNDGTKGKLIYVKLAMIEGLPTNVYSYKGMSPDFPHESTADQFFNEKQFEAYRELGYYIGWQMMESAEYENGDKIFPIEKPESKLSLFYMTVRINNKQEDVRVVNFPINLDDVGIQIAEVLCNKYDQYVLGKKEEDNLPDKGTAEAEIEHLVYRFTYNQVIYSEKPDVIHYYVKSDQDESKIWHSSTNIDERG